MSEKFASVEKLAKDNCLDLCDLGDLVYLRLVQLFYANLNTKIGTNGLYLVSLVKSVQITINWSVLETIFGLKFLNSAPPNFTRKTATELCLTHFTCPQKLESYKCQNRTPPYYVLFPEPQLLHYVFVWIFYPKDCSKEAYNEIALESIYRQMNGYLVDYALLIVNHMHRVANLTHPSSLPYGNLLTHIFTYFKVPLNSEECVTWPVPVISANSLKPSASTNSQSRLEAFLRAHP